MADLIGQTLGPYQILEQLGAGGMATVYKAYHPLMDRYVAIKILLPHLAQDAEVRARFQREARTIARLEHRHILTVYDVSEDRNIPYLVMRYTDGGTLGDLLATHSLSIERMLLLISQVADALGYAHQQGIVHRDIKPANVLIDRNGAALLSDFGIAKILEDTLHLTTEGVLIGTPFYMAPEQVRGQPADARTDLYALGVVLYEAVTGQRPFVAETPLAVALMHVHNPLPPPRQINQAIPEALERTILKALAKDPDHRFQSADEFLRALQSAEGLADPAVVAARSSAPPAVIASPGVQPASATLILPETPQSPAPPVDQSSPPAPISKRRPGVMWGLATLALVGLLSAVFFLNRQGEAAPQVQAQPTVMPQPGLRVFANTLVTQDLAVQGDQIWAATTGGLVRWQLDGTSQTFTIADGLPFNNIRTLLAHPDGSLWAGGDRGVAHIDLEGGGKATHYTSADGLSSDYVGALLLEKDGSVIVGGLYGNGVSLDRFDGQRWSPLSVPRDDPLLAADRVNIVSLLHSKDDALWIGLAERGIVRWNGTAWTGFPEIAELTVSRMVQDQSGTLWAAAGDAGLWRFDSGAGSWSRVVSDLLVEDAPVRTITQVQNGDLWVSSNEFVAKSADRGASWQLSESQGERLGFGVDRIIEGPNQQLWAAGQQGLSRFADGRWQRLKSESVLPDSRIGRLIDAGDRGLLVFPLYGGPVTSIDPATFKATPDLFTQPRINALAFSAETVWLGTNEGVIRQRGPTMLRLSAELPSAMITQLLVVSDTLWIGTDKGLLPYAIASEQLGSLVNELHAWEISALTAGPAGTVWAGAFLRDSSGSISQVALGRFDGQTWQIWEPGAAPFDANPNPVTAIAQDSAGRVWVALDGGGVHRWDGAAWQRWVEADGAPTNPVRALVPTDDGMWLAGDFSGLYHWSQAGWTSLKIERLTTRVNSLELTDDGAFWLGTDEGLIRHQP